MAGFFCAPTRSETLALSLHTYCVSTWGFVVNVSEAARGGSELDLLVAMRDRVADAVADPECPKRDLASLTLRLSNIVKEIKALESAEGGDDIGEATSIPDAEFDPEAI